MLGSVKIIFVGAPNFELNQKSSIGFLINQNYLIFLKIMRPFLTLRRRMASLWTILFLKFWKAISKRIFYFT